MAVMSDACYGLSRLARFVLLTHDAVKLAAFYEQAFGFEPQCTDRLAAVSAAQIGISGCAIATTLHLGREMIELIQCDQPGRPVPADAVSSDLGFQHLAIIVNDIADAYRRLCSTTGWRVISAGGPQRLPESSGGVTAFKFRDPDGHPLELLSFPKGKAPEHWRATSAKTCCLGIDHSAISISDVSDSVAFYEALGLRIVSRSLNRGPEQACLDNLATPHVDVIALAPGQSTPHLELLGYRDIRRDNSSVTGGNDVAATRLIFETEDVATIGRCLIDPDGHRIVIEPRPRSSLCSV